MQERLIAFFFLLAWGALFAKDLTLVLAFSPIFMAVGFFFCRERSGYFSYRDCASIFVLIFFAIAPLQSFDGTYFTLSGAVAGVAYHLSDLYLAVWIVSSTVAAMFFVMYRSDVSVVNIAAQRTFSGQLEASFGVGVFSLLIFIAMTGGVGAVLLPRSERDWASGSLISPGFLAAGAIGCSLCVRFFLLSTRRTLVHWSMVFGLIFLLMICVNPFNSARFFLLATWTPVCLAALRFGVRFRSAFALLLIGLFFIAPILSETTRKGVSALGDFDYSVLYTVGQVRDADVFDTLVHSVGYVRDFGFRDGENFLATILFAVPRALWVGKPVVGGLIIGDELLWFGGAGTANLSFFFGGDAYMDFGMLAPIVAGLCFGYICAYVAQKGYFIDSFSIVQAVLIGCMPILLRGPLGAVVGYPFALVVSAIVLNWLLCSYFASRSVRSV